ncbi:hypothetical protein, conserved in T. vivax [Trypanosoma vivax Y486]|uniref:Uncharacterized protein n=1 Tax=Trypanosoma vivax (strain Y486) TaxID=1055687 RepID=F9WNT5_TRYVY|nr:hypothetical protein, conserved in T. vivax [Trypanosoma vivax Y486]|eukprot:CCD19206.1 hypothetical protein, conserved in T. vivax [Trypanosoma vivax Y486]
MCSSARAITELREQHHQLRTSTTSLQHDVSMASTSATTAWATAQTLSQLPSVLNNSLAEATATVKVLGHQLTGIVEKSDEVVQALETAVTNADKFRPSSSSVLGNLVRAIDLNLNYTSFKPDCSVATDITVVRKLATSKSDLFKYVSELEQLGELVKTVNKAMSSSRHETSALVLNVSEKKDKVAEAVRAVRSIADALNGEQKRQHATAFAQALVAIKDKLCDAATKLHELNTKNNEFKGRAFNLETNISRVKRNAENAWQHASDAFEMPQEVEDGFTYASRGVAVLEKHLKRADAQYITAVNDLVEGLKGTATSNAKMYDAVGRFVRSITLNLTDFSSHSLCNKIRINELVASLLQRPETMLQSAPAVEALRKLEARVTARLTAANGRMGKVVSSAADAQAAVEEATRRAHEAAAGRRCTPLHRQLLNVLQHIW